MYGREQMEQDLAWLDSQRALGARLLVEGKMNGFEKLELDTEIDRAEQKCRGKLAGVRMAITDRETMIRSGKMRYWKRSKGKLLIKNHGKDAPWRTTTEAELQALRSNGYYVIELKGFPPQSGGSIPTETPEPPTAPPAMKMVSIEEGRKRAAEGEMVIWRPNEQECAMVMDYA